jgi:hypothetical protein
MAIYSQEIAGLDRLMRKLAKFGDAAMPLINDAVEQGTRIVHQRALELVPVGVDAANGHEAGNLKRHIKISRTRIKQGVWKINNNIIIARGAEYGVHVELGHGRVRGEGNLDWQGAQAHPFLRPASHQSRDAVRDITIDAMNKALATLGDGK